MFWQKKDYLSLLKENLFDIDFRIKEIKKENLEILEKAIKKQGVSFINRIIDFFNLDENEVVLTFFQYKNLKQYIYDFLITFGKINNYLLEYPDIFFEYIEQEGRENWIFVKWLIDNEVYLKIKDEKNFHKLYKLIYNYHLKNFFLLVNKKSVFYFFVFFSESFIKNLDKIKDYYAFLKKAVYEFSFSFNEEETLNLIRIMSVLQENTDLSKKLGKQKNITKNNFYFYLYLFILLKSKINVFDEMNYIKKKYWRITEYFLPEFEKICKDKILEILLLTELLNSKKVKSDLIFKLFINNLLTITQKEILILKQYKKTIINDLLNIVKNESVKINPLLEKENKKIAFFNKINSIENF